MILLFQLAVRNLLRNLRRTLLSMGSIIAGVWMLILGQGFIGGMDENIIRSQVDGLTGHVSLRPKEYPTSVMQQPIDHLFSLDPALIGPIEEAGGAWTTRLQFNPTLIHGGDAMRVRAIAIDPSRDAQVFPRDTWHVTGDCDTAEKIGKGLLLSQGIANTLDVFQDVAAPDAPSVWRRDAEVLIKVRTVDGAINALSVPVCGVFTTGNMAIDKMGAFVTHDFAKELLLTDKISHAIVRLPSRDDARPLRAHLETALATGGLGERLGGPVLSTWEEDVADMMTIQKIRRRALNLLVFALLGMSALGILNTILMAAYERIREIGTLRAMGLTRGGVLGLFLVEGTLMGLVGGSIGAALGAGMTLWLATRGINLAGDGMKASGALPVSSMLYVEFSPPIVLFALAFAMVVAVIASIYPSFVASRMQPADAIRAD